MNMISHEKNAPLTAIVICNKESFYKQYFCPSIYPFCHSDH